MIKIHEYYLQHLRHDIPAGLVVFLIALPLCLGIALASGAPLHSGIIAGIIGGTVVAWASGSQLCISGPAAALAVIVLHAIERLGSFQAFLLAVILAGGFQLLLGFAQAGVIAAYFPSAVIKGLLAAIGLILVMKQIPHALGYDTDYIGDQGFIQPDHHTTFSEIFYSLQHISPGAVIVSTVAIGILLLWETAYFRKNALLTLIPGPLVAVLWGILFNAFALRFAPALAIAEEHLVSLPELEGVKDFFHHFISADFSYLGHWEVYTIALTLGIVASLESLLSLEAVDKLDPDKRIAPTNRELKAQGLGNIVSGLLGGLPLAAVIVRSSANINAGARTKMASFVHGLLLALSVIFLAGYLNLIPLASLAAVLLLIGYKLAAPRLFREMYGKGVNQFVPFIITIIAIFFTDLLIGMIIGIICGLFFVIQANFQAAISLTQHGRNYLLRLNKDVSFLNKALLREFLSRIENNSFLIIDGSRADFIDHDILETIYDFIETASGRNITVELKKLNGYSAVFVCFPHERNQAIKNHETIRKIAAGK